MATEALTGGKLEKVLAALDTNWQAEMEGHWTYQTLAERDSDPVRAQVLQHLAGAEWEHAALGAGRIRELDGQEAVYKGSDHGDADSLANRAGGIQMALRRLEIDESRDIAKYGEQLKVLGGCGVNRHPQSRDRRREGSPPRTGISAARTLSCLRRFAKTRHQSGSQRFAGKERSESQAAGSLDR